MVEKIDYFFVLKNSRINRGDFYETNDKKLYGKF